MRKRRRFHSNHFGLQRTKLRKSPSQPRPRLTRPSISPRPPLQLPKLIKLEAANDNEPATVETDSGALVPANDNPEPGAAATGP